VTARPGSRLVPVAGLTVESFDDALLVWDESRKKLHHFDRLAAAVWQELDGRSLAEVASTLAADLGADESLVRHDLLTLGNVLLTEGLAQDEDRSESHAFDRGHPE
jgi:hypothetical protein